MKTIEIKIEFMPDGENSLSRRENRTAEIMLYEEGKEKCGLEIKNMTGLWGDHATAEEIIKKAAGIGYQLNPEELHNGLWHISDLAQAIGQSLNKMLNEGRENNETPGL